MKKKDDNSFYIKVDRSMLDENHSGTQEVTVYLGDEGHPKATTFDIKIHFKVSKLTTLLNGEEYCDKACLAAREVEAKIKAEQLAL